jgi:photosystem II stability/assembly factor-like uncharacterized protein
MRERAPEIHAIALNPDDPHQLFLATHEGIVRGQHDRDWRTLGTARQDLTGFVFHPSNASQAWASGHAKVGTNLGMLMTWDGGETWERRGLDGEDVHAIVVSPAGPENIWAWASGTLYGSTDAGATWQRRSGDAASVVSLTADLTDPDALYAATGTSIEQSIDGGSSWGRFADAPIAAFAFSRTTPGAALAVGSGGLLKSQDGGRTWETVSGDLPPDMERIALDPDDASIAYAASTTAIYKTEDGGSTWKPIGPI